jgi:hypothetical protein
MKFFCYIGIHNWIYKREKHPIEDHPSGRNVVRVLIRECKCCGHREHHLLPRINGKLTKWMNWDNIKENDIINYKQL